MKDNRLPRSARSIIEGQVVVRAFMLSFAYHLILLAFFPDTASAQMGLFEFWLFTLSDIAIWTLGLIPLMAVLRRRMSWYDPLFVFWMIVFGTFSTIFVAVYLDPATAATWMSFGAYTSLGAAKESFYFYLFQAEIVVLIFLSIVLLMNRQILRYPSRTIEKREGRAALLTSILLGALGIYAFISYWQQRSFAETMLSTMGYFSPEGGAARLWHLQLIAVTAASLGILGWLALRSKRRGNQKITVGWLPLIVIFGTLPPYLVTGSRLDALIALAIPVAVLGFFNFSFRKMTLAVLALSVLGFWLAATVLRGNTYAEGVSSFWNKFQFSQAFDAYSHQLGSASRPLLYADRIGNIAFIVQNMDERGEFLYGKSLIAGLGNFIADLSARVAGTKLSRGPFLMANQYIADWRFGNPYYWGWPVPPSIEGEFYMQGGYVALMLLSYGFGIMFRWMRRKLAETTSFIGLWVMIICSLKVAFYAPMGETSTLFFPFIYVAIVMTVFFVVNSSLSLIEGRRHLVFDQLGNSDFKQSGS